MLAARPDDVSACHVNFVEGISMSKVKVHHAIVVVPLYGVSVGEIDERCSISLTNMIAKVCVAQRYVPIGIPTPQYVAACIFLNNLVEEDLATVDRSDVVSEIQKSIVEWVVLDIVMTINVGEVNCAV